MIHTDSRYPYRFDDTACGRCQGRCCTGESGYIWVGPGEIEALAEYLGITSEAVIKQYLDKVRYRYTIREKSLGEGQYACYEARPMQCRTFPFWDYFLTHLEEVKKECPGIC